MSMVMTPEEAKAACDLVDDPDAIMIVHRGTVGVRHTDDKCPCEPLLIKISQVKLMTLQQVKELVYAHQVIH